MVRTIIVLALAVSFLCPLGVFAQDARKMFPHDTARTVFDNDFHFPVAGTTSFSEDPELERASIAPESIAPEAVEPTTTETNFSSSESIMARYGDPAKPHPVTAQDTAPAPYRAMIEALKIGDEELAFKYAMQYEKYQKDVEDMTHKAVAFQGKALQRLDLLPQDSWAGHEQFDQYNHLLNLDLPEENADESFSTKLSV